MASGNPPWLCGLADQKFQNDEVGALLCVWEVEKKNNSPWGKVFHADKHRIFACAILAGAEGF